MRVKDSNRRSIRLAGYDYAQAGAYFITICAHDRECLFGEVVDDAMNLNQVGRIVEEEWLRTAAVRSDVELDQYVIMPNHVHGIIVLVGAARWVALHESERGDRFRQGGIVERPHQKKRATQRVATTGPASGSMGAIIGQFKSIATKRINYLRRTPGAPVWQRNYYEHVIRDEFEMLRAGEYIRNNPLASTLEGELAWLERH
ncbi:MAG: transposase [candidate division Zixibacteria bacterium]|nr:transposase [candidate division Zixibacteria bacterium]